MSKYFISAYRVCVCKCRPLDHQQLSIVERVTKLLAVCSEF